MDKENKSAVKIQAAFRGVKVRKQLSLEKENMEEITTGMLYVNIFQVRTSDSSRNHQKYAY